MHTPTQPKSYRMRLPEHREASQYKLAPPFADLALPRLTN